MKFSADMLKNSTDLEPIKPEPKVIPPNLYIRFAISGHKVTISKDLRDRLFSECTHLLFKIVKQKAETKVIIIQGLTPTKIGKKHREIKGTRDEFDPKRYYYVTLSKAEYEKMDSKLTSQQNAITSRKYIIKENAMDSNTKALVINLSDRNPTLFEAGYAVGNSPSQRKNKKT